MDIFFQYALPGLTTGCIYALVALGFVLCANVSGLVNFAQGEYVMLGGLIGASLSAHHFPLVATLAIAIIAGAMLGFLQERLTLAPVRRAPHFIQITITLGVSVIVRGLALIIWDKDPLPMPGFTGDGIFMMFGAILPIQNLWVWGTTILMLGGLFWFLKFTPAGRAVRACSINMAAARLMGINAERMSVIVFAVAGAAAALGGAVIAPIALGRYDAGLDYGLKGFIGAIIGGFRSPSLAVAGGLGIGLIEALAVGYISSGSKDVVAYGALLIFLLIQGGVFAFGRAHLTAGTR